MLHVLSVAEARFLLVQRAKQRGLGTQKRPLAEARGMTLAEHALADADLPAFNRSAVDGYAVCAENTFGASAAMPALLRLVGEVRMGERAEGSLGAGECFTVWTGGELPQGANAMVMLEDAQTLPGGLIAVESASAPGRHVVFRGDDAKQGDPIVSAGTRLGAREIGLLSAFGKTEVLTCLAPRVNVLSTGDELIDPADMPQKGQIRDINGPMLTATCAEAGAEARFLGRVADDEDALLLAVRSALETCDLLLLSGGSSAGAKDAAARTVEKLGQLLFHGLALKPGKPTLAGEIGGKLVVCLPGHPAAAYLVFHTLVRPVLKALLGEIDTEREIPARLTQAVSSNHGREELLLVRLSADGFAEPILTKSGLVSPLTKADGYAVIPRDTEGLPDGATVRVVLF